MNFETKKNELKEDEEIYLLKMLKTPDFADWHLSNLSKLNSDLGFYELIEGRLLNSKKYFSIVGNIDIYLVENYYKSHSRFLDFDIPRCLLPVLSDNELLIQRYSKLRYQKGVSAEFGMGEMVAIGETAIWCNTVQFFMANDNEGVVRNLNILETITLKKLPKNQQELLLDYEFYKALLASDKAKMEEVLEKLVSNKIHKKRNDNPILNQYISLPALGYAKLAWSKGIEVEVNSPLVPKELLPIKPNESYEIPYDFLK